MMVCGLQAAVVLSTMIKKEFESSRRLCSSCRSRRKTSSATAVAAITTITITRMVIRTERSHDDSIRRNQI